MRYGFGHTERHFWNLLPTFPVSAGSRRELSAKAEVLERAEAWGAAGITHLVLDCTSANGDRLGAVYEVMEAFA